MDALKRFMASFTNAGPDHGQSDESSSGGDPRDSTSGPAPVPERQLPSKDSQVAGAAALARHEQQQQQQFASSRSLAAIRDRGQARKELEAETAAGPRVTKLEMAPNLADVGVYYKCPIIGGDVMSGPEILQKIKLFLYEQLAEDDGIAACLIIHSCNPNKENVQTGVETLCKYMDNITSAPAEKYRRIRQTNKAYVERVAPLEGAAELLSAAGFESTQLPHGDGQETFWVFPPDGDLEKLQLFREALVIAEPIVPELDRNARALMPSQAARQVALPPDFFAISGKELQREQLRSSELVENLTQLQPKATRRRVEQREVRKYLFSLVRVRFPDAITLQGTFRVQERVSAIFAFVRENLVRPGEAFELLSPSGQLLGADDQTTLAEAKLTPSVLLTWQPMSDVLPPGGNTGAYLIPELMEMIAELG